MLSLGRQRDGACSMQVQEPKARRDWADLLFTAFGRIVDQQVDGDVAE